MNFTRKALNLYLYSSCHIALGAVLFTAEAYSYIEEWDFIFLSFVFCSTVLIYSIHRIVGINKLSGLSQEGRFQVIARYQDHIKAYIAVSLLSLIFLANRLSTETLIALLPVGVISLLYTLPILTDKKRLRDFHYIKIILICFVWAYIAALPLYMDGVTIDRLWLYFLEKFIFILAITLPFDIRDFEIDGFSQLMTIPKSIGVKQTYALCTALLALGFGIQVYVHHSDPLLLIPYLIIYLMTYVVILISRNKTSDYYYSGLLDGTLLMRGIVILCLVSKLN